MAMSGKQSAVISLTPLLLFLCSCAMTRELPPQPPKYVYQEEKVVKQARNSLWSDSASLYEDFKARRLNDLVTINVVENIVGSGTGDTKANRDSATNAKVDNFFGTPTIFNWSNFWGNGYSFEPKVQGSMVDKFTGSAATSRQGKLVGTITAKVVEVLPNGNLVLESRKEITINRENQVLVLRGIARPDDIGSDNVILSSRVADARLYFVGAGVVSEKQSPGWLVRVLDQVWPF
jgi:flagellar L-ring protein precursor FlgH